MFFPCQMMFLKPILLMSHHRNDMLFIHLPLNLSVLMTSKVCKSMVQLLSLCVWTYLFYDTCNWTDQTSSTCWYEYVVHSTFLGSCINDFLCNSSKTVKESQSLKSFKDRNLFFLRIFFGKFQTFLKRVSNLNNFNKLFPIFPYTC